MAIIGDALRQAFMPKREYENLRDEDKALTRLQRPLLVSSMLLLWVAIFVSTVVSLKIVFPGRFGKRPFCGETRIQPLSVMGVKGDSDRVLGAFFLTDQETADYYWMVVFLPSFTVFLFSSVYVFAGIAVAYSAPTRSAWLKVVENNYCASKRGGVRCLSILNVIFAIVYSLLAIFLGSSLLTLGSSCSSPLFWCYEITAWSLVVLYGGTALLLKRKAAVVLDEGDFAGRNLGLEMLEATPYSPDVERRVGEGFRTWMGSSLLSSDDEDDEPDSYQEVDKFTPRQRL